MVPNLEQLKAERARADAEAKAAIKKKDSETLARKARREARINQKLTHLTQGLDFSEKTIFSAAYRASKNVGTEYDLSLLDTAGIIVSEKLDLLNTSLRQRRKGLTPDILWTNVPSLDPHKLERRKQGLSRGAVIIDLGNLRSAPKPLRKAA